MQLRFAPAFTGVLGNLQRLGDGRQRVFDPSVRGQAFSQRTELDRSHPLDPVRPPGIDTIRERIDILASLAGSQTCPAACIFGMKDKCVDSVLARQCRYHICAVQDGLIVTSQKLRQKPVENRQDEVVFPLLPLGIAQRLFCRSTGTVGMAGHPE